MTEISTGDCLLDSNEMDENDAQLSKSHEPLISTFNGISIARRNEHENVHLLIQMKLMKMVGNPRHRTAP
jgi:hypothetical protein